MPTWREPTPDQTSVVTGLLNSKCVVSRHVLPDGERVEVAHIGTQSLYWVVTWTGRSGQAWPEHSLEAVLMRVDGGSLRQQTWLFMEENSYDWTSLLRDAWGLGSDIKTGRLA